MASKKARWINSKFGSGATFYVGKESLGSISYEKGGFVGRGVFGSWKKPEPDREHAQNIVVESVRASLQSQLKAINEFLGR